MTAERLVALLPAFAALQCQRDVTAFRYPPVLVVSRYRLPGVVVRGASRGWWRWGSQPVRYGEPVPVGVTMYCLQGTTRRGRYVRGGIVAADPRFFPLSKFIELYVGRSYLGRFLVDDTGKKIRGARIDIWTDNCRDARRFGIARGTAVLVDAPGIGVRQAGAIRTTK
ncbi:MAG TPA: 3D domain-containing protein [Gemmatimonadaceae bacterium]